MKARYMAEGDKKSSSTIRGAFENNAFKLAKVALLYSRFLNLMWRADLKPAQALIMIPSFTGA